MQTGGWQAPVTFLCLDVRILVCYRDPHARTVAGGTAHPRYGEVEPRQGLISAETCLLPSLPSAPLNLTPAQGLQMVQNSKTSPCRGSQQSEVSQSPAATLNCPQGNPKRWRGPRDTPCSNISANPQLPCDLLSVNTCLSFPNLNQEGKGGDTYLTGCVVGIEVLLE